MRANNQTTAFAREEGLKSLDLGRLGLLTCDVVIETEDEQRVGVGQDALVYGQAITRVIDTLEHRHGMSRDVADAILERQPGAEKQFERAGDPLRKRQRVAVRRLFPRGPCGASDFRHRGEAIVHHGNVAIGLCRITPGDIQADAPLARRVFARDMSLVIGARTFAHAFAPFARKRRPLMPGRKK